MWREGDEVLLKRERGSGAGKRMRKEVKEDLQVRRKIRKSEDGMKRRLKKEDTCGYWIKNRR